MQWRSKRESGSRQSWNRPWGASTTLQS